MEPLSSVPNCELLKDQLTAICKTQMNPSPSLLDKLQDKLCFNLQKQYNMYCKRPSIVVSNQTCDNPKVNIDRW